MNEASKLLKILEIVNSLDHGESISIEEILKKDDFEYNRDIKIIAKAFRFNFIFIDGKYSYQDTPRIEKHHRITALDRDGYIALDFLKNQELVDNILKKYSFLNNCDVFSMVYMIKAFMRNI